MINFCIFSKRLRLKQKGLFEAKLVSLTKKEYGFPVHFLEKFIKPLNSVSDK